MSVEKAFRKLVNLITGLLQYCLMMERKRIYTNDLVNLLLEFCSWKVSEPGGKALQSIKSYLVDSAKFVHFLLYDLLGSISDGLALSKEFSIKFVKYKTVLRNFISSFQHFK